MHGWILDYRKELESDIWKMPPLYHRVWQYLKYKANHSPARIPNKDGSFINLLPGQHATSYRNIAAGVGYYEGIKWKEPNPKTIKGILNWMVKQEMIQIAGNSNGTIITVINWEKHQEHASKHKSEKSENLHITSYGNTLETVAFIEDEEAQDFCNFQGNAKETLEKHLLDTNKEELKNDKEDKIDIFFETIWKKMPNKKGKSGISTSQKKKLYKIGLEPMTKAIAEFNIDMKDRELQFIPYGSTFFNTLYKDYLECDEKKTNKDKSVKPKVIFMPRDEFDELVANKLENKERQKGSSRIVNESEEAIK